MKILFTASEGVPFIKTGGLADVVGALAPVLAKQGHDVRVMLPLYAAVPKQYVDQMTHVTDFEVALGWRRQYCGIELLEKDGVKFYFVDNKFYFGRPYIYGMGGDEYERFGFFCRAALNALPLLDFQPDVIHAHDWQSGMVPALLKIQYAHLPFFANIKTVFTIHNLQYQGVFGIREVQDVLGLGDSLWTDDKLECYGCANFMKAALVYSDIITTHFEYHSIDANLLKLDELGHDDPTMIRMLEDITHLDAQTIPLDNPEVMSLFKSTEALGIKPEDIGGCPLGCLGVPEFGTDFVIQMLLDTKPQSFSDLIRISGLSHGTDVWLGNAQTLSEEGKATISTAICTRDDIMIYLIDKGLESELSFTIMESVRKGKGLKPEWEEEMKAHDVPDWYIWSCKKIKYMFPKAHAAAYVMMAYRIAYYKIFYPLAYYAAYFSIRASAFSYELMCMGRDRLEYYMKDYEKRKDTLTQKEQATVKDMKIVQEMYARGFDFVPVDLYKAQAHRFQVYDDKHLMPALDSIEGLGDTAAAAVVLAARNGKFLSKDDFRDRTKVSKTIIDFMADLGVFGDLPESNQFSLFDY